jgi:hypothetical protein
MEVFIIWREPFVHWTADSYWNANGCPLDDRILRIYQHLAQDNQPGILATILRFITGIK